MTCNNTLKYIKWQFKNYVTFKIRHVPQKIAYNLYSVIQTTQCLRKHVKTFSTSWTKIARLQQFCHTYYHEYRPSTDVFIFSPHLLALTLGNCRDLNISKNETKSWKFHRKMGFWLKNLYHSVKAVWCTKAVSRISRLGLETWKHRQSAKDGYNRPASCGNQPAVDRVRRVLVEYLLLSQGGQAKKAPISSWAFV